MRRFVHNKENGFGAIELLAVILIVVGLGLSAWFVWQRQDQDGQGDKNKVQKIDQTQKKDDTDPYADWSKYTSTYEKLSFRYPADWKVEQTYESFDNAIDRAILTSPSGLLQIYWEAAVDGLGGACDSSVAGEPPYENIDPNDLGPCPYWYVLDSQRLTQTDLYYVAGVVTSDGISFKPWCALQPPKGSLLESGSYIGYQTFDAKNSPYDMVFKCNRGSGGFANSNFPDETREQATARLSSDEFKQAKLMLLSATY